MGRSNVDRNTLCAIALSSVLLQAALAAPKPSGKLEIHYVAVGQGGATLIVGPDGTKIMFDFGRVAGKHFLVPYLLGPNVKMRQGDAVDFAVVSHGDKDHYMGYKDFSATFGVTKANYRPESDKKETSLMRSAWLAPAKSTQAKEFKAIPVGLRIHLGDGAEAHVAAANGLVIGDAKGTKIRNENDRSVALFVRYGKFSYIIDGDLGGGAEACTGRQTKQVDVQSRVARALIDSGLMSEATGVDVLHVAHHGSESSTSAAYYNIMKPEVALISVGADQDDEYRHPRENVVDRVLLDKLQPRDVACVVEPPVKVVLQTGNGKGKCGEKGIGCTSYSGAAVGNIVIATDGQSNYTVRVDEPKAALKRFEKLGAHPWTFPLPAK